jgi:serine/threonine protein kinase
MKPFDPGRPEPEHSLAGRQLGPYFVQRTLGRGGMGEVYLAHDTALDRSVAIKTLMWTHSDDVGLIKRFQREARASAKLSHPNIVQVYVVDIESDPPYMAMEFVDGRSLDAVVGPDSPLSWQKALTICGQVAAALMCAHEQGIIHRDIKPANIMLEKNGRARVTDFGIAKVLNADTTLTSDKMTVGSPCYMSPEQCGVGDLVPASDLFSLGITTYEMLSGKVPWMAENTVGLIKKITMDPLPPLGAAVSGLPSNVEQFVETLTEKDLAKRYATAADVLADLNSLREGRPMERMLALRNPSPAIGVGGVPAVQGAAAQVPGPVAGGPPAVPENLVDDLLDAPKAFDKPMPKVQGSFPWPVVALVGAALVGALGVFAMMRGGSDAQAPAVAEPARPQPPPPPPEGRHPRPHIGPDGQPLPPPGPGARPPRDGRRPDGQRGSGPRGPRGGASGRQGGQPPPPPPR